MNKLMKIKHLLNEIHSVLYLSHKKYGFFSIMKYN